tara:strand:- start:278 stop:961 length:684 start_codon:yes stop_codon:yes gene_type:complete
MRLRHYSIFNELEESKINWDYLRENNKEPLYYMPNNINDYNTIASTHNNNLLIKHTLKYVKKYNLDKLLSLGSGRAIIEYQLKLKSNLYTTVSDITNSINKIKELKIFDEVLIIDFTKKIEIDINSNTLVLLSRVDTELEDFELKNLFKELHKKNVNHILFIPAQLLNVKSIIIQFYIRLKSILLQKKLVDCGYSRSRSRFIKLMQEYFYVYKSYNFKFVFLKNKNL